MNRYRYLYIRYYFKKKFNVSAGPFSVMGVLKKKKICTYITMTQHNVRLLTLDIQQTIQTP
ncbi:hypothetical protein QTP88_008651 [Uroleucon formosanum]